MSQPKIPENNSKIKISNKIKFETTYLEVFDVLILMKAMIFSHPIRKHQQFQHLSMMVKKSEILVEKVAISFEHSTEILSKIHIPNRYLMFKLTINNFLIEGMQRITLLNFEKF